MYDDIANSEENPFPGKVFNKPNGKDVYVGCKASYTGKDVSAEKFLAVLTGDKKTAQGPVLRSSKRDNVFVYYADHGAPGLIAMPEDEEPVYAKDLNAALKTMHKKGMYDRLVFYLEACESGSMFDGGQLATDTKVYATTAANSAESSYGSYCGEDAVVNGKNLHTCLGDLYSVSWLEDADGAFPRESLQRQMQLVTKETNLSHVQTFGDASFASDFAGAFEGDAKDKRGVKFAVRGPLTVRNGVDSRTATLAYLRSKVKRGLPGARTAYLAELAFRAATVARFDAIAAKYGSSAKLLKGVAVDVAAFDDDVWACYKSAVDAVRLSCSRGLNDEHVLGHVGMLGSLCADGAAEVAATVRAVCA